MTHPPPAEQPTESPAPAGDDAPADGAATTPAPRRRWLPRRRPAGSATPEEADGAPTEAAAPVAATDGPSPVEPPARADDAPAGVAEPSTAVPRRLRRDRRRLIARREAAVYHLGGLAFELYRRDMLQEDVMRLRAGEVAQIDDTVRDIDVRLGEIDRERRERRRGAPTDPSAGCCLACRAPFRAEARYCWQCGTQLVPPSMGDEQVTAVIGTRPAP